MLSWLWGMWVAGGYVSLKLKEIWARTKNSETLSLRVVEMQSAEFTKEGCRVKEDNGPS